MVTRPATTRSDLVDPTVIGAVALLAVNDHVLKGRGWLPGWLTGKLSDLAGLYFFPVLLVVLAESLGRRRRPARSLTAEQWRQVQAVHIALVVRGDYNAPGSANQTMPTLALFPNVQQVEGTNAQDLRFTPTQPQRHRAVFTATVRLRNPLACDVDVC